MAHSGPSTPWCRLCLPWRSRRKLQKRVYPPAYNHVMSDACARPGEEGRETRWRCRLRGGSCAQTARRGLVRFPLLWRREYAREQLPMVGWYDPLQLLDAGSSRSSRTSSAGDRISASCRRWRTADPSTTTTRSATATGAKARTSTATRPRDEIWIDYICDTGDGWNSTYAVAFTASQPVTRRGGVDGAERTLPAPARRRAGVRRRRGVSDAEPRRVPPPADRPLGDRVRRHPDERVAARVRHSRQPRLVRRPERVRAALLLARRRPPLRGLAHAPAPQLLRPEASAAAGG